MHSKNVKKHLLLGLFICLFLSSCTPTSSDAVLSVTPTSSATSLPEAAPPQAVELGILGKGSARDFAWSPDGKVLAVLSTTGIYLYDTQSWEVLDTLTTDQFDGAESIFAINFSPADVNKLVVVTNIEYEERGFWKYDLESKQLDYWLDSVNMRSATLFVFSPDGEFFALQKTVCGDGNCLPALEIRASDNGDVVYSLPRERPSVRAFVFSPDGKQFAVARSDNLLHVWDMTSGEMLYELQHDSNVADVSYSPDGSVLVSTSNDATVRFWDAQNGENLYVLRGFDEPLQIGDFFANGMKLLVGELYTNDYKEYALDESFLPVDALNIEMEINRDFTGHFCEDCSSTINLKISPDMHRMAVLVNHKIQIWDLDSGEMEVMLPGFNGRISALAFSPDGNTLAVASWTVQLWDVRTQTWLPTILTNDGFYEVRDIAFRPHSNQIALVHSGKVQIWDTVSQQVIFDDINSISECYNDLKMNYSPDGKKIAIMNRECGTYIRDADTGQILHEIHIDSNTPEKIQFSSDGKELIVVHKDVLQRWNLETGQMVYSTKIDGVLFSASTSSIGTDLLVYRNTNMSPCLFFDLKTGQHLYSFAENWDTEAIALHANDRLYARSNDEGILFSDASSGQFIYSIPFDMYRSYSILFSPDRTVFAAHSDDQTIHLWNISSLAQQAETRMVMTATPDPVLMPTVTSTSYPAIKVKTPLPSQITQQTEPANILKEISVEMLAEYGFGNANEAAWSPDGKILAVGSGSGLYVFQQGKLQPEYFLSPGSGFNKLVFSPDGRLLAGQINNDTVEVWNIYTGERLFSLEDNGCWGVDLIFSMDSQQLSAYCGSSTFHWSMLDGSLIGNQKNDTRSIYSPDGNLAFEVGKNAVVLKKTATGEIIKTFDVPDMATGVAAFSPDGETLLVWFYQFDVGFSGAFYPGRDHKSFIQAWDVSSNSLPELRSVLDTGEFYINTALWSEFRGLVISPDSSRAFTASGDGQVDIFDITSGDLLATLPDGERIFLSPDGNRLLTIGHKVQEWDVTPGREPVLVRTLLSFSDFDALLTQTEDDHQLVTASHGEFRFWEMNGAVLSARPTTIEAPEKEVILHAVSPDGNWLAYNTEDDILLGKNNSSDPDWRSLKTFFDNEFALRIRAMVFSPDGSYLAVKEDLGQTLLWDLTDLEQEPINLGDEIAVEDFFFSSDSNLLFGIPDNSWGATIYLWNTTTGEWLQSWIREGSKYAFHPDGTTLAVNDYSKGYIAIYRLDDWTLLQDLHGQKYVFDITFSPDGSLLVSCGEDGLEFWDAATGTLLKTIDGSYWNLIFSPDGKTLTAGSRDGRIRIFDVSVE